MIWCYIYFHVLAYTKNKLWLITFCHETLTLEDVFALLLNHGICLVQINSIANVDIQKSFTIMATTGAMRNGGQQPWWIFKWSTWKTWRRSTKEIDFPNVWKSQSHS